MNDLLEMIPMKASTRAAYRAMPSPQRAWALAKAAYEVEHERNFAEQTAAAKAATADDPEPMQPMDAPDNTSREDRVKLNDAWLAWSTRNRERIDAANAEIVARYPKGLKNLAELAEKNMVEFAEEKFKEKFPERYAAVEPAFRRYHEDGLYGDMRQKFLTICFNCPDK